MKTRNKRQELEYRIYIINQVWHIDKRQELEYGIYIINQVWHIDKRQETRDIRTKKKQ